MPKNVYFICFLLCALYGSFADSTPAKAPSLHISLYDTEDPCLVDGMTAYVLEIRNEGYNNAEDVAISVRIPAEMVLIAAKGAPYEIREGRVVFENIKELGPREVSRYMLQCKPIKAGLIKSSFSVQPRYFPEPIWQEEATRIIPRDGAPNAAAIHVNCYDTEDPCYVKGSNQTGQTTYVIEILNEGTVPAHNLQLENQLSNSMEYVDISALQEHKLHEKKVIFEPVPELNPGGKLKYKITAKPQAAGCFSNTATVIFDGLRIVRQEATTAKIYHPFLDRGYVQLHLIETGEVDQFIKDSEAKGLLPVGAEMTFTLGYPIASHPETYLKVKTNHAPNCTIEIWTEYYSGNQDLILSKKFTIPEWKPLVILLEGQEKQNTGKKCLRVVPRLEKEKHPLSTSNLLLHLEKFYFFDTQKQKLLAAGGVTGHIIGINVPGEGFFEFSLQHFSGARPLGILSDNEIAIYSHDNWKVPGYKIIASNTIIGGHPYWVWVKRSPAREGTGVTIETRISQDK